MSSFRGIAISALLFFATLAHAGIFGAVHGLIGKSFGDDWSATLSALNAGNRRYLIDDANTFGGTHWANPREITVQLRYRFHY